MSQFQFGSFKFILNEEQGTLAIVAVAVLIGMICTDIYQLIILFLNNRLEKTKAEIELRSQQEAQAHKLQIASKMEDAAKILLTDKELGTMLRDTLVANLSGDETFLTRIAKKFTGK